MTVTCDVVGVIAGRDAQQRGTLSLLKGDAPNRMSKSTAAACDSLAAEEGCDAGAAGPFHHCHLLCEAA